MSGPEIEVIVDKQGRTQILTRGFSGSNSLSATRDLELALGRKTRETKTAEFYETQTNTQQQRLNN